MLFVTTHSRPIWMRKKTHCLLWRIQISWRKLIILRWIIRVFSTTIKARSVLDKRRDDCQPLRTHNLTWMRCWEEMKCKLKTKVMSFKISKYRWTIRISSRGSRSSMKRSINRKKSMYTNSTQQSCLKTFHNRILTRRPCKGVV